MNDDRSGHLARLDDIDDLKVADGYENVRGWSVLSSDGLKVGEVKHLIADPQAMRVRYLEVELDAGVAGGGRARDRRALLPIGGVRLDDREDHVVVDTMASAQFATLPTYADGAPITRSYETSLRDGFAGGTGTAAAGAGTAAAAGLVGTHGEGSTTSRTTGSTHADDFYAHDSYSDDRFRGGRRATGDVRDDTRPDR
jgi:hypothetical protein